MWNLVNGSSVSSKNRGQPMRSTQSPTRSQSLASSLYTRRIFFTIAAASGQRGGLFGMPAATSLWNMGLERAFEFLPPTQMASLLCSGSLICIGGQGGEQAPQQMHFFSSTSSEGLQFTIARRIAATGQRATTLGPSPILATRSWLILGGLVC